MLSVLYGKCIVYDIIQVHVHLYQYLVLLKYNITLQKENSVL